MRESSTTDCTSEKLLGEVTASRMTEGSGRTLTVSSTSMGSQWTMLAIFGLPSASSRLSFTFSIHPQSPLKCFSLQVFLCVLTQVSQVPRKGQSRARQRTIESATRLAAVRSGCLASKGYKHSAQTVESTHRSQKVCPQRCRRMGFRITIRHTPQIRYFVRESSQKVKSPQQRASGVSELLICRKTGQGRFMISVRFYMIQCGSHDNMVQK